MKFYESESFDPAWNLALEEYVFEKMPQNDSYFIPWQNDNTIVVGKNQNTFEEINETYVKENNITVVRRLSGGGAVYHDLGNLNYTFITDSSNNEIDFNRFCGLLIGTLNKYGVIAKSSSRNDITIDGRKFSGNAQYIKNGRVMHHGTILFDSDLDVVKKALKVKEKHIESKSQKSIRSEVINLCEVLPKGIALNEFKQSLIEHVFSEEIREELIIDDKDLSEISVKNRTDKL